MLADVPTLVLPCETRARELDAKLLLACHAAERGLRAVVGAKKAIDSRIDELPPSIYVAKSVTDRNLPSFRILRRLGHAVAAWDEEGLVWASPELYRRTKVSSEVLNGVDCLFAWGEENAAAWRGHPGYGGTPIRMTGNPRADLLRPELRGFFATEAEELAARFGEFVLLNTNFSRLNHYTPGESRQRRLIEDAGGPLEDGGDPRLGLAAHKQRLYRRFLHLVPKLGRRFPRNAIVVRPHPSENPNPWRQVAAEHPNVHVVHEGSVVPWLMAARAVVHNGCTTAVETFLLGGVPLAYRPVVSEEFDHPLPNALGVAARDDEALLEHVENALGGRLLLRADTLAAQRRLATRHVASLEGESACARIAAALEEILATTEGQGARALPTRLIGRFSARRRGLVKRLEAVLPNHRNNSRYVRHLFPPIGVEEVEARVARFASLLGRFTRVRARELRPNVFAVQSG